jgi:dolichol-phosphate mannosyltransferase
MHRTLAVIPTYNEVDNLVPIVRRLLHQPVAVDILIVDDNSPDGTGDIADGLASEDSRVHVLHRPRKEGLAAAYRNGFVWGLRHGYDQLVECDADGSHQPEELPRLLQALTVADVVVGSRWIHGGSVVGWPYRRQLLSRAGSWYARLALHLSQRDVTSGYRAFRATALEVLPLDDIQSEGYSFQIETLWRARRAGLTVAEVPITLTERQHGVSKMHGRIVVEALLRVTAWALSPIRHNTRRPVLGDA